MRWRCGLATEQRPNPEHGCPLLVSLRICSTSAVHGTAAGKSLRLTAYLEYLFEQLNAVSRSPSAVFTVLTSSIPDLTPKNGAQLSILTGSEGKKLFDWPTG
ncbi:MAG: hypothetical protein IPN76_28195 [Saprospiraceae bacterium]|nr:hypothetical protein [Saprospiraceae bacterium]